MIGVYDRMEIWDREAHERYLEAFGGAYQAGTLGGQCVTTSRRSRAGHGAGGRAVPGRALAPWST